MCIYVVTNHLSSFWFLSQDFLIIIFWKSFIHQFVTKLKMFCLFPWSVIWTLALATSPGNALEMQNQRPHPKSAKLKSLVYQDSRWSIGTFKFNKQCFKVSNGLCLLVAYILLWCTILYTHVAFIHKCKLFEMK